MMSLREFVELGYDEEEYNEYVEYENERRNVYVDDDEPDEFDKAMYYDDEEEDEDKSETE
jgi:hypothetical protein